MKQKHLWQLIIIVVVVVLSVISMTPPTSRDLLEDFQLKARNKDATYSNIVARVQELDKTLPNQTYANLKTAIGTNDLTPYFAHRYNPKGQKNPSAFILSRLQRDAAGKIKLGLDLQGGTSFLVGMDTANLSTNTDRTAVLEDAVEILRKRVDGLGVAEPILQPLVNQDRIVIQLPGLTEAVKEEAIRALERAAFLEFRMVHPESDQLLSQGIIEPGYEVLREEIKQRDGSKQVAAYLVKKGAERGLTGKYITSAMVARNHINNEPEIQFEMNSEGAKLFAEITREFAPKGNRKYQLAIVLDGELYSAPTINSPIEGGRGVITGRFDYREARELANALENPLEAPIKILDQRSVDPSLGKDSVRSGILSCVYGTIGVAVFMMGFYFFAGAVANFALFLNIVITMGIMCALGSTLTLPGIAGLVLSIGMAVDANVLIFERIREELAAGKSLRGALAAGYDRAFGTILDSHVTTLISAGILYWLGSGPIKGFGVMLAFGVGASLFTALVVTRLVFDLFIHKQWMKSLRMMPVMRLTKVDFMGFAKAAMAFSAIVIIAGAAYGVIGRGQKMMGVDFQGGDSLILHFKEHVEVDKLRETVGKLGVGDPTIQYQKNLAGGRETLQILVAYDGGKKVEETLKKEFPAAQFTVAGIDKVGPSVGKEIQQSAVVASILAMLGILLYVAVRYEFTFAVAAVLATAHDVLFAFAIFAFAGLELSATTVAAFLTIIGYSINDKIVILDRIREDLKLGVRGSFREVINLALNQTLSRTLITGGSVILATLALLVFGGGVIYDFAFTFLVGIFTGTYSSVYIACALVLWLNKGQRPKASAQVSVDNPNAAAPARANA